MPLYYLGTKIYFITLNVKRVKIQKQEAWNMQSKCNKIKKIDSIKCSNKNKIRLPFILL